jgi:hypothetical protein
MPFLLSNNVGYFFPNMEHRESRSSSGAEQVSREHVTPMKGSKEREFDVPARSLAVIAREDGARKQTKRVPGLIWRHDGTLE